VKRVQIRKVARLGTGHTPSRSVDAYWEPTECTIPWLTLADVWQLRDGSVSVVHDTKEKISPLGLANSAAVRHPAGTVAFSRTASVGFSCILGADMATSQDFVTWTCGPQLDPRYLLWVLRGERDDILRRTQGSTHKTIYMPDIEQLTIPLPPLEEQNRIVESLDHETARIDRLVALKADLMTAARRRFVSTRAERLLGGLDPTSGEGSPPRGWPRVRLASVIRLQRGHDLPVSDRLEGKVPVIGSGGPVGEHAVAIADGPGVVTGRYGTIGEVFFLDRPYWPLNTTLYVRDFRGHDPAWVFHLLSELPLDLDGEKTAVTGINRNVVGRLIVPVPPREEQMALARFLDAAHQNLGELEVALERQVQLLHAHRRSLIAAAVAGERTAAA
jgi:restriction endonuclease S subunit